MNYKLKKLENGVPVLTVPIENLESATVTIWVGTGSRFEEDRIAGLSHFLEHMVFKGSKKRPSAKEIAEAVDSIGGEFNAGTSKEWTNFYIKTRVENLDTAFDVLSDMVLNPLIKEEDIEREKGVIVEEIGMYEDTPVYRIGDVFEQLIFEGNSLGRDIIGSRETVTSLKRKDFVDYRNKHYFASNMLLTVAGGIKDGKVEELAKKHLGKIESKGEEEFDEFKETQKEPKVKLHGKKKEQAHFILGFLTSERGNKDRFAESVLTTILGRGMSSRMFTEVREKRGLCYSVRSSVDRAIDTGYIGTYAGVDTERIDQAIEVVLSEHYKLASGKVKVTKEELEKAKEYTKGHLALSLEDTKAVSRFFGEKELLLGEVETPDEVFEGIDNVTIDDVVRVASKYFVPKRLNLAVIGPYDDEGRFKKLLK